MESREQIIAELRLLGMKGNLFLQVNPTTAQLKSLRDSLREILRLTQ
ncbi:MAG: hypothetical protein ABI361_14035 [Nitrososphaera sp.]|jgi:hypothetical protein